MLEAHWGEIPLVKTSCWTIVIWIREDSHRWKFSWHVAKVVSSEKLKFCARLADMNSDWRLGLKISSVMGWRGRLLGAKHCVGLAHMPCQSSLMSLLPQASKVSFRFNAKLSKCVRHAEEKRKKQKARVIWPWGKSWSKRAIRPFFGVSSRESKT